LSYAVQFWPAQYYLEKRSDVFAGKYRLCSNAFCTVVINVAIVWWWIKLYIHVFTDCIACVRAALCGQTLTNTNEAYASCALLIPRFCFPGDALQRSELAYISRMCAVDRSTPDPGAWQTQPSRCSFNDAFKWLREINYLRQRDYVLPGVCLSATSCNNYMY